MKAIVLFSSKNNEFAINDHNLTDEEGRAKVADLRAKGIPAYALDQDGFHDTRSEPEKCRKCSGLVKAIVVRTNAKVEQVQPTVEPEGAPEWRVK